MNSIERSRLMGRFRKLDDTEKALVSRLKSNGTEVENRLWGLLHDNKIFGLKFRRQHKVGQFVLDFFCIKCLLAIEVDGSVHDSRKQEDAQRSEWLETLGIRLIRFSNEDVLTRPKFVIQEIENAVASVRSR